MNTYLNTLFKHRYINTFGYFLWCHHNRAIPFHTHMRMIKKSFHACRKCNVFQVGGFVAPFVFTGLLSVVLVGPAYWALPSECGGDEGKTSKSIFPSWNGEAFHIKGPVKPNFISYAIRSIKLSNKQSNWRSFETITSLWRHCNTQCKQIMDVKQIDEKKQLLDGNCYMDVLLSRIIIIILHTPLLKSPSSDGWNRDFWEFS